MNRSLCLALVATLITFGSADAQGVNSKIAATKGWLTDLNQGKALSRKTGKPLFVVIRCEP